jgi:hypothetical protein
MKKPEIPANESDRLTDQIEGFIPNAANFFSPIV